MTTKWVASDDQPKMITRKKDQSLECCFSSQTVSTSQTSELLTCNWKITLKYRVKQSKNGTFTSNYKASLIDFKTQISLRR